MLFTGWIRRGRLDTFAPGPSRRREGRGDRLMFENLREKGFQIEFVSHAEAILRFDFPDVAYDLESVLANASIPIAEIIRSGGGETKATQRLRRAFVEKGGASINSKSCERSTACAAKPFPTKSIIWPNMLKA